MTATIEARVTKLEKEQETMWLLGDTIAADCAANRASLEGLTSEQRQTRGEVLGLTTEVCKLRSTVASLELTMRGFEDSAAQTNLRVLKIETDVADLKTDVADLKTDVADLKTEMGEVKATQIEHGDLLRTILSRLDGPARN